MGHLDQEKPTSPKSTFFIYGRMADKYNLPHIHIKGVIDEIKSLPGEFGDEIRNFLTEKK